MALTVSLTGDWLESLGNMTATTGTITFDSSYATGGESLTPANVGLGAITFLEFNAGTSGYVFKYDYGNQKVLVYQSAGFTPAGSVSAPTISTVDDSGSPTKALGELAGALSTNGAVTGITGVQAPTFTGNAVAAAGLSEVPAATNLSSLTVAFRAIGR